jgi:streptomycin 6-kinase
LDGEWCIGLSSGSSLAPEVKAILQKWSLTPDGDVLTTRSSWLLTFYLRHCRTHEARDAIAHIMNGYAKVLAFN